MPFKVKTLEIITLPNIIIKQFSKLDCYGWIVGGNEKIYGICSVDNLPFFLIEYNKLKPAGDSKLNG